MKKVNFKLSGWLKKNEIYFRTIATLLISIMAVLVSMQTNRIAKIQAKLSERQVIIDKFELLPSFSLKQRITGFVDSSGLYRVREIKVFNNYGGKFKNLELNIVGSFDVFVSDPDSLRTDLKLNGKFITVFLRNAYKFHKQIDTLYENGLVLQTQYIIDRKIYHNLIDKIYKGMMESYQLSTYFPMENFIYTELKYLDFLHEINYEYYDIYYGDKCPLLVVSEQKLDYVQIPERQIFLDLRTLDTNNMNKIVDQILDMSIDK